MPLGRFGFVRYFKGARRRTGPFSLVMLLQTAPLDFVAQYVAYTVCHTLCDAKERAPVTIDADLFESMRLELRRGSLVLAVLACLRTERYGYTLRQALAADGLEMEESTLYPLLRRLESQGLLLSEWREEEKRKKRFYVLSPMGLAMLDRLAEEWRGINASLDKIL